jgi:hypothetical protein
MPLALGLLAAVALIVAFGGRSSASAPPGVPSAGPPSAGAPSAGAPSAGAPSYKVTVNGADFTLALAGVPNTWLLTAYIPANASTGAPAKGPETLTSPSTLPTLDAAKTWAEGEIAAVLARHPDDFNPNPPMVR